MIKTQYVELKVNSKVISHYKKLGYNVEPNKIYKIKTADLTSGSKINIIAECDICGKEKSVSFREYNRNVGKHNIFCCSNKCAIIKNKKTSLYKYGVDHFSKTKEFIEKIKATNLNNFGFEFYTQTEEYRNILKTKNIDYKERLCKQKKTHLIKYGNENYHQSQDYKRKKGEIIEKYKNTITKKLLNKYGNKLIFIDNKEYVFLCEKYHEFKINRELLKNRLKLNTEICTVCNPIGSSKSGYEIQLIDFITSNISDEILRNNRTTLNNEYELDIYIPKMKLAFEFNGLFWHNELNKDNNYHLEKTEICEKNEIQLIHIWEDDWRYRQDIIKSIILNKIGAIKNKIYARKCVLKEINDNKIVKDFLIKNHLQGNVSSLVKIGLYYEDELVSLMIFGKKRNHLGQKNIPNHFELLRFCNKLDINVIGGASKLFKYFIDKYQPKEITTYVDRSYSQGLLYKILGFNFINKTEPNYYYIINDIRYNRFNFRKDILVKQGFDKSKTVHQIMIERKFYRIYDSGNLKYIFKLN